MSSGGWELSKENIQPLSSGRRMAHLAESLHSVSGSTLNDQQLEAHHWEEIRKLEEVALKQAGSDPLQEWVELIKYIQQHFPVMNAKVNTKYKLFLRKAVQLNLNHVNYKNDRRLIELILKSAAETMPDPMQQLELLRSILTSGIGDSVSAMYVKLAEIYESKGDEKSASDILRKGIQNNAEPKSSLDEMMTHIQNRWAEKYAKTIEDGSDGGVRKFAASVPTVGRNNEAITIRRDLPPAAPATDKQNFKMPASKVHVLHEENSAPQNINNLQPKFASNGPFSLDKAVNDRENQMEATRWNTGTTHLDNPAIPEPPQKLTLFVEESVFNVPSSKSEKPHVMDKRALKERTEATEETDSQLSASCQYPSNSSVRSSNASHVHLHNNTDDQLKKDVSEDIKYKKLLPARGKVNRMMIKAAAYLEKQKLKELENNEVIVMRKEVMQLKECINILEDKIKNQSHLTELKLMEKDERIQQLELNNESVMHQLTHLSTSINVRESQFEREKNCLEKDIQDLKTKLENVHELKKELAYFKKQYEILLEEKKTREAEALRENESESDYANVIVEKKSTLVKVDVQRSVNYISSSSGEQCTGEISRFHSGENTIASNSFLPDLRNASGCNQGLRERKGLAEIHKDDMMMNITPAAAPPEEYDDVPPPCFSNFGFKKPAFALYESISESFAKPNPAKVNSFANNKRTDVLKSLHMLPENLPPQQQMNSHSEPVFEPQPSFVPHGVPDPKPRNENFLVPCLPSSRRSTATFSTNENLKPSVETANTNDVYSYTDSLYNANGNDSDSEEEIMVRRHQQTGLDLNMSNLTCALSMGPIPLTNSTPEKAKNLPVRNQPVPIFTEDPPVADFQTAGSRVSRYHSVLNDPELNLSTIQETSRENRSRSTTSSSSGNYTASTTRFGMATSTTQFYNNITRSSSIPRSNSHMSQLYSNGYHSDTNGK